MVPILQSAQIDEQFLHGLPRGSWYDISNHKQLFPDRVFCPHIKLRHPHMLLLLHGRVGSKSRSTRKREKKKREARKFKHTRFRAGESNPVLNGPYGVLKSVGCYRYTVHIRHRFVQVGNKTYPARRSVKYCGEFCLLQYIQSQCRPARGKCRHGLSYSATSFCDHPTK